MFHFWSIDVYDAIPTVVTTFVAIMAKISILILLLDFILYSANVIKEYLPAAAGGSSFLQDKLIFSWTIALLLSGLLSLIIGTVLGLTQFRIKRLLAYILLWA